MSSPINARALANLIAATLGETDQPIPEGHVYAAVMGRTDPDTFERAIAALIAVGLIERRAGPVLVSTEKCRAIVAKHIAKEAA